MFAKLKALLRKAAARTVDQRWQTLGAVLDEIQSEECRYHFGRRWLNCTKLLYSYRSIKINENCFICGVMEREQFYL